MRLVRVAAFFVALAAAVSTQASTYNCFISVANPSKDEPSCANTASCNGDSWRWSNRADCEITCMVEGPNPGQMTDVGSAQCQKIADNGEPDCGGWPCI